MLIEYTVPIFGLVRLWFSTQTIIPCMSLIFKYHLLLGNLFVLFQPTAVTQLVPTCSVNNNSYNSNSDSNNNTTTATASATASDSDSNSSYNKNKNYTNSNNISGNNSYNVQTCFMHTT